MIWREVLEHQGFQKGYLEINDGEALFGGPILRMEMPDQGDEFVFVLEWCAKRNVHDSPNQPLWDICENESYKTVRFNYKVVGIPRYAYDENSFRFKVPGRGNAILLPQGYTGYSGRILEPKLVRGLYLAVQEQDV